MDVRRVFQKIAVKLQADFELSAEVRHDGSKGTIRENALRRFLAERMPARYGLGAGEIVGPQNDTSHQSDLILFDRIHGVPLIFDESTQVFPIECIYGTIEVKSRLSKAKLIEALACVRSVKALVPDEVVEHSPVPGFVTALARPRPFGIVFAYALEGNSLASLAENLTEWEKTVEPELWPNVVAVLGEGLIYHCDRSGTPYISNDLLERGMTPTALAHRADTLFHAYAAMLDLAAATNLSPPLIRRYFDLPKRHGSHAVKHHDGFVNRKTGRRCRLTAEFVDRVATWCSPRGKISVRDLIVKQIGALPDGAGELPNLDLDASLYHYDPEGLPGTHGVATPWSFAGNVPTTTQRLLVPNVLLEIDGDLYDVPQAYVAEGDLEPVPDRGLPSASTRGNGTAPRPWSRW